MRSWRPLVQSSQTTYGIGYDKSDAGHIVSLIGRVQPSLSRYWEHEGTSTMVRHHTCQHGRRLAVVAVALGLAAACSAGGSGSSGSSAGGPGVAYGSKPDAYAEALKDADPITIDLGGLTTGPGAESSAAFVEYGDLVEEMSGGKIVFKYDFGGAKVSLDKMTAGMKQGRIDMGLYIPAYEPDEWPLTSAIAEAAYLNDPNPVLGRIATFAALIDFGASWEPLQEESERHGIRPLYTLYSPSDLKLQCGSGIAPLESLDDFEGKQVRVASGNHAGLAKAFGAVPVSLTFPELFTGLQRGVVDCAVNTVSGSGAGGFHDITDSWTVGTEPGGDWGETPSGWGISRSKWQSYPLAAQQLLWDTQPRMLELVLEANARETYASIALSKEAGMSFGTYSQELTDAAHAHYAQQDEITADRIEELGATEDGAKVISDLKDSFATWWTIVREQYPDAAELTWENFTDELDPDLAEIDMAPITDRLFEEVLLEHRPE